MEYKPESIRERINKPKRNVLWFSLPFSKNLKINIGKKFTDVVDKSFPSPSEFF